MYADVGADKDDLDVTFLSSNEVLLESHMCQFQRTRVLGDRSLAFKLHG